MKKRFLFLLLFLLILLIANTKVKADSIGVSPGKLFFDNVDNSENEFIIYNPNDDYFNFNVYSEPLEWIKFMPESGIIEPKGKTKVNAELIIPEKTKSGKYETFIYVNNNKNNNNTTLIKTGAAIKAEITIKQGIKPSVFIGVIIISIIIILGVLLYKKINFIKGTP